MPVPDITYFGENPEGEGITYGEARNLKDDQTKLLILNGRIDAFLIRQIDELSQFNNDGKRKVYSPFPLTVLTLLGIETLGHIINDVEKIKSEGEFEQSKRIVTPVYLLMDRKLSHKPTANFYAYFEKLHGVGEKRFIDKYSDVIHRYQRNTFTHGYQSRGVYLTEQIHEPILIDEEQGCLFINPYLFWCLFKSTQEKVFVRIMDKKKKNKEYRDNALRYFERLIG